MKFVDLFVNVVKVIALLFLGLAWTELVVYHPYQLGHLAAFFGRPALWGFYSIPVFLVAAGIATVKDGIAEWISP